MRLMLRLRAAGLLTASIAAAASTTPSPPPAAAGRWEGVLTRRDAHLAVSLALQREDTSWRGTFDAPDLRALGVPLSNLHIDGPKIAFALVGDSSSTTFDGTLDGDVLQGRFQEGDLPGTFTLRRAQSDRPPFREEPVRFRNGDVTLSGTLFVPAGTGRHPAVLFLHGSGPEARHASRFLADALARRGIVTLTYDKRGVGESTGDWRNSNYPALADDASAGLALLRQRPEVDPRRIGLYGHSQGGFIGPLVAVRSKDVAFVIAAAGPAGPAWEQDLFRVGNAIREAGFTPDQVERALAFYGRFVTAARSGEGLDSFFAEAESLRTEPWFEWLAIPPRESWIWGFYRGTGNDDSLIWWRQVKVPVLLLYGERDALVPVAASAAKIEEALRQAGNSHFAVVILPRASHPLTVDPPADRPYDWPRVAAGLADLVAAWALAPPPVH